MLAISWVRAAWPNLNKVQKAATAISAPIWVPYALIIGLFK